MAKITLEGKGRKLGSTRKQSKREGKRRVLKHKTKAANQRQKAKKAVHAVDKRKKQKQKGKVEIQW